MTLVPLPSASAPIRSSSSFRAMSVIAVVRGQMTDSHAPAAPAAPHEAALGLVREFLSKHGLQAALAALDSASPRTEASVAKRSQLVAAMHLSAMVAANKGRPQPLP